MIVLDTDHISVLQHAGSDVANQLAQRLSNSQELIATTSITVEEQCRSWLGLINRYSDPRRQVTYYDRFIRALRFFGNWRILPFDERAADEFTRLRQERVRIATTDLKKAFRDSVDDYLAFCEERGEEPDKPFSGQFVTRIPPELHRQVSAAATLAGKSLNAWVTERLQAAVLQIGVLKRAMAKETASRASAGKSAGRQKTARRAKSAQRRA